MDPIDRQAAIDTEGLDEQIRCEMCTNPMHTSRGCDGNCTYDEKLYEKIMQILDRRIKHVPSAQPEPQWGKTVGVGRPLADCEIVSRLRDIQKQVGGSYAIDRAIEVIEAVQAQPDIIACGDCKHYIPHDKRCGYWNHGVQPLMWCSQAERRWKE